jgi:hypothetical protein
MIDPKSSGPSSDQKDESKSELVVRKNLKGQGKEIERPKPGRLPLFRQ